MGELRDFVRKEDGTFVLMFFQAFKHVRGSVDKIKKYRRDSLGEVHSPPGISYYSRYSKEGPWHTDCRIIFLLFGISYQTLKCALTCFGTSTFHGDNLNRYQGKDK